MKCSEETRLDTHVVTGTLTSTRYVWGAARQAIRLRGHCSWKTKTGKKKKKKHLYTVVVRRYYTRERRLGYDDDPVSRTRKISYYNRAGALAIVRGFRCPVPPPPPSPHRDARSPPEVRFRVRISMKKKNFVPTESNRRNPTTTDRKQSDFLVFFFFFFP